VHIEIEFQDENEIVFAMVAKCEENLTMEVVDNMNETTMNIDFDYDVELTLF